MTVSYNPQPFINGYISMIRNMFLTSSIGLAAMGFSNRFKQYEKKVKIIAVIIILYSILYGYKASKDSNNYINYIEKQEDLPELYTIMLNDWRQWIYITYIYMILTLSLSIIIFTRKIYV